MAQLLPYIPSYITVHLGPPNSGAENVTVSYQDYVKNVASSEVYPTWNENALRANILAITAFALAALVVKEKMALALRPQHMTRVAQPWCEHHVLKPVEVKLWNPSQ